MVKLLQKVSIVSIVSVGSKVSKASIPFRQLKVHISMDILLIGFDTFDGLDGIDTFYTIYQISQNDHYTVSKSVIHQQYRFNVSK